MNEIPSPQILDEDKATRARDRTVFAAALFCASAVLAVIAAPMLAGRTYTLNDLGDYHIPMRAFYAKALSRHENFTWFPGIYCGYYLHGDGQVGMFHPLHLILYRALPFTAAFNIELFLPYPLLIIGTLLFLRRWGLARGPALFGGMIFALGGFNLLHFIHVQAIATLAHLPWLLISVDMLLRAPGVRRAAVAGLGVSLLVASMVLLGYPQYVWYVTLAAALYAFFLVRSWVSPARPALLILAVALGTGIGAVQLLPTFETLHDSIRLDPQVTTATDLSLPPANLVQFVGPYLLARRMIPYERGGETHEFGVYDGAAGLALFVLLALTIGRLRTRKRLAVAALALWALAVLLSLGVFGGLYNVLLYVPLLGAFRAPVRYMCLAQFALAVGAAVMLDALVTADAPQASSLRNRARLLLALPVAAVAALVLAGFAPAGWRPGWAVLSRWASADALALLSGPVLLAAGALLVIGAARRSRPALAALVVFAAGDLGLYGLSYIRRSPPETVAALAASAATFECPSPMRLDVLPPTDSRATLDGCLLTRGYAGLPPRRENDYTRTTPLRLASTVERVTRLAVAGADGRTWSAQPIPSPMPRARMVTQYVLDNGRVDQLDSIDIATTAVVRVALDLPPSTPGSAELAAERGGYMRVGTQADARQLLVVSTSWHRGWRATVDGAPAEVLRACGDFMAVEVEAGRHEVEFFFEPASLRIGAYVTMLALALTMGVFCLSFFTRRR